MVHLNQNNLSKKQLDDLFTQLSSTIAPADQQRAGCILTELLGIEERIMIAKRLAAVGLLAEGASQYKIGNLLKLSQSTIAHINEKLESGQYNVTLKNVSKTKKDYFTFLNTLDNILHLGGILPHYNGLDRYRGI